MQKPTLKTTYQKTFGNTRDELENDYDLRKRREEKNVWGAGKQTFKNDVPAKRDQSDPPWLKAISALANEKGREKEGLFLAEGNRVVAEIVEHHADLVKGVYVEEQFDNEAMRTKIKECGLHIHTLNAFQMKKVNSVATGQGIFAVCRLANEKPNYDTARMLTLVDAVQDPGNLGALFRTAIGFGFDGMVLGRGTTDPFNPKTVRGSAGSFLRMPFEKGIDLKERFNLLRQKGFYIVATSPHAKKDITDLSTRQVKKIALLVGNEGSGTDQSVSDLADEWVKIPMERELESLNVAVAHGILCYQIAKMRKGEE